MRDERIYVYLIYISYTYFEIFLALVESGESSMSVEFSFVLGF